MKGKVMCLIMALLTGLTAGYAVYSENETQKKLDQLNKKLDEKED